MIMTELLQATNHAWYPGVMIAFPGNSSSSACYHKHSAVWLEFDVDG
jgi:hypothetical protein